VSALVLDAGAFVAVERNERRMVARLRVAAANGMELRTHPLVVAQVWRDHRGRQVNLARLLSAIDIISIDASMGRACGALLGKAGMSDPVDATVVLISRSGDRIATSDPDDIQRLIDAAGRRVTLVPV
jgi:hypothetical protein